MFCFCYILLHVHSLHIDLRIQEFLSTYHPFFGVIKQLCLTQEFSTEICMRLHQPRSIPCQHIRKTPFPAFPCWSYAHPACAGSPCFSRCIAASGHDIHGILKAPSVCIAFDHDLDEGFVHHIHFLLAVAIREVHLLSADNSRKVLHIIRHDPVKSDV